MKLRRVGSKIAPAICDSCGKSIKTFGSAVFVTVIDDDSPPNEMRIVDIYLAHKGECDHARGASRMTRWMTLRDVVIPAKFMGIVLSTMEGVRSGEVVYTDAAWRKWKKILRVLSQYAMRTTSTTEFDRLDVLATLP